MSFFRQIYFKRFLFEMEERDVEMRAMDVSLDDNHFESMKEYWLN